MNEWINKYKEIWDYQKQCIIPDKFTLNFSLFDCLLPILFFMLAEGGGVECFFVD